MSLPTIRRPAALLVSASLREERERRKIGLRRLADKLSMSPARLSGLELGTHVPHAPDVAHILGFLGISGAEYEKLIKLAKQVRDDNLITHEDMQAFSLMWTYEQLSDRVVEWSPFYLPDQLRLRQHFDRDPSTGEEPPGSGELEPLERAVRQQAMLNGPRRYLFLIGEEAVRAASSEADSEGQVRHLRTVASLHHVSVRIVPTKAKGLNPSHAFTLYESRRTSMAVAFKNVHCNAYLTEKPLLDKYSGTAEALQHEALSKSATADALGSFSWDQVS
ncbi:Scr1 family TA system antitoxin-like transcriptional regulator [Amycolatopsis sp. NPDC058278]|uniref:Scr1 family TA system antitoxin-like transcriptional regulator n=1 Tax=Amycolatopsis sp. NPDC058278 TaxID=3346417 RepID=UPI0036D79C77